MNRTALHYLLQRLTVPWYLMRALFASEPETAMTSVRYASSPLSSSSAAAAAAAEAATIGYYTSVYRRLTCRRSPFQSIFSRSFNLLVIAQFCAAIHVINPQPS